MSIYKRKILIERIVLIGPMKEAKKWIEWCGENGYGIIRSGPKKKSGRNPYFDSTKFRLVAERRAK